MICKICGFTTSDKGSYSHLFYKHNLTVKQYYDKYLRQENEGVCPTCGKQTPFFGLSKGYQIHCCNSCAQLDKTTQSKIQQTCLARYGVQSSNQSPVVQEKMKKTLLEHYGVDNCQKCKSVSIKAVETRHRRNLKKYGVTEPAKLPHVKAKIGKSVSNHMLARTPEQKTEFYNKIREIKRQNKTLSTSKPEEDFYAWLLNMFNINDVYRNYSFDIRYPFACDFYIKSLDLFIELNLYWMHGGHWFDIHNKTDSQKLAKWKDKAQNGHKQYKAAVKVWSISDPLKCQTATLNHLNYVVLWNSNDILEFQKQLEVIYEKHNKRAS